MKYKGSNFCNPQLQTSNWKSQWGYWSLWRYLSASQQQPYFTSMDITRNIEAKDTTSLNSNSIAMSTCTTSNTANNTVASVSKTGQNGMEIVQAIYDFDAIEEGSLSFKEGDLLQVLNKLPSGWWDGILVTSLSLQNNHHDSQNTETFLRGWFPSNYIKEYCASSQNELPSPSSAIEELESMRESIQEEDLEDYYDYYHNDPTGQKLLKVPREMNVKKELDAEEEKNLRGIVRSKKSNCSMTSSVSSSSTHNMKVKSPLLERGKSNLPDDVKYDSMGPFSPSIFMAETTKHISLSDFQDIWYLTQLDYDEKQVIVDEISGRWKGATLHAYICKLTNHLETDDAFTTVFLSSYRTFTTSSKMLTLLLDRFSLVAPDGLQESEKMIWMDKKLRAIRFRVYMVLKTWLETYIQDDREDQAALSIVKEFAETVMKEQMSVSASKILHLIESRANNTKPISPSVTDKNPSSIIPKSWIKTKLLDLDPLEVAQQVTLLETTIFQGISATELITTAWTSNATRNVSKMIIHCKKFTAWVSYSVLQSGTEAKKRAKMIFFFISVAQELLNLRNFNALSCILQALGSKPIKRLNASWNLVSHKQRTAFRVLLQGGISKRFIEYKLKEKSSDVPCMPLFPYLLNEFEGVKRNYATNASSKTLYSYEKLIQVSDLVKCFKSLPTTFQLHIVPKIKNYLEEELERKSYTEDELIQLSMHVEPDASAMNLDKKKLENLLGNIGL